MSNIDEQLDEIRERIDQNGLQSGIRPREWSKGTKPAAKPPAKRKAPSQQTE